jgi:hypothetical protein
MTRRVTTIGLGLAGVALAVVGSGCFLFPRFPRCRTGVVDAASITPEDRAAAMMSIHAHSYHKAGILPLSPERLKLPPLCRAVDILLQDPDTLAASRLRRAVSKLAAYGGNDPQFVAAWHALLRFDETLIKAVQDAISHRVIAAVRAESRVYNVLGRIGLVGCTTKDPVFNPPVWQKTGEVSASLEVTVVQTDVDTIARRIDPQSWDNCKNSTKAYWADAHLTTTVPPRTSTCPIPASPPDPPENDAQQLGSEYHKTMYERFVCHVCPSDFKILLHIDAARDRAPCGDGFNACGTASGIVPYEACYNLSSMLAGCASSNQPVHMTYDKGSVTACAPGNGDIRVHGRKELKFEETLSNAAVYALHWIRQMETTEMLAEMVCCPA